ncbi:MAG: thiamine phosphate synthase [Sphingomonadales bacterium]|nr:MAG: thiamine phosphate synthase [Sphingomonadales bacterium]
MPRRHPPLPRTWLMTDERMGDSLWDALERLPKGSGVVFRHYSVLGKERRRLFAKVTRVARRRRLILIRAGADAGPGEHGAHNQRRGTTTAAAHSRREAMSAIRSGARLLFASPVFPTRSHPEAHALGRVRLGLMIRGLSVPIIALGGMDARKVIALRQLGIHGWAAIDAWAREVPRHTIRSVLK